MNNLFDVSLTPDERIPEFTLKSIKSNAYKFLQDYPSNQLSESNKEQLLDDIEILLKEVFLAGVEFGVREFRRKN